MRVRFKKGDPRAGMVVNLDASAAKRAIDAGEAEEVTGKEAETDSDRQAAGGRATAASAKASAGEPATTRQEPASAASAPAPAPAADAKPARKTAPAKKAAKR